MKVKTSELTDVALDWAVAKCVGILTPIHGEPEPRVVFYSNQWQKYMRFNPHRRPTTVIGTNPPPIPPKRGRSSTGNASERGLPTPSKVCGQRDQTTRSTLTGCPPVYGPTSLIAAMRCYVASKLGDEVEVPDELFA